MERGQPKRSKTFGESLEGFEEPEFNLGSSMAGFTYNPDVVAPPPAFDTAHDGFDFGGGGGGGGGGGLGAGHSQTGFSFGGDGRMAVPSLLAEFDGLVSANHAGGEDSSTQAIDTLAERLDLVSRQQEELEFGLKNYIAPLTAQQYEQFNQQISDVQKSVTTLMRDTQNIINQELLLPSLYVRWKEMETNLATWNSHLDVYRVELKAVFEKRMPEDGFGQLVVVEQPFPAVVKQKEKKRAKTMPGESEPLRLRLLTGARAPLAVLSKIKAEMIFEGPSSAGSSSTSATAVSKKKKKKVAEEENDDDDDDGEDSGGGGAGKKGAAAKKGQAKKKAPTKKEKADAKVSDDTILGGLTDMQPNGQAMFEQLRFSKGTGVKIVRLRFTCTAESSPDAVPGCGKHKFTVQSSLSAPFIVMTNESQFSDSAMKLLETEAFAPMSSHISWIRFANLLQYHYLMCTRQPLTKIVRPLTRADLAYLWETRFLKSTQVSKKAFEEFWAWFGSTLHKIRHQKPVPQMWEKGYIFGFISKEAAAEILKSHKVGTFLVRFSERTAGRFAVAYVAKGSKVKHFLVPVSSKKLSDVLKEKQDFTQVLLCKTDFKVDSFQAMVSGTMQKDGAFAEYYTSNDAAPPTDGYDDIDGDE